MVSAEKLKKQSLDDSFVVEDFVTLAASCNSQEVSYKVISADHDKINLMDGDHRITIINASSNIALNEEQLHHPVLCGHAAEVQNSQIDNAVPLTFPITFSGFNVQIAHIFSTLEQKKHDFLNQEAAEQTLDDVRNVLSISRELNGIRDVNLLLDLILKKVRKITNADAGSIFAVNLEKNSITFKVSQNDSIEQNLTEFSIPVNDKSIVGNCVLLQRSIEFEDLYRLSPNREDNPYGVVHDVSWDKKTGYECHSMVSIPMFNIAHDVIGVIQLINRKKTLGVPLNDKNDFKNNVSPFTETDVDYAEIVAHQAGIALENAYMSEEIEAMFSGFVNASVHAIEQRDPTTSGHSHRVAMLTLGLAEAVNKTTTGNYGALIFNSNQLKEIEYASLLHDFGKIGVSENILIKEKKLFGWEMDLVKERFELIKSRSEIEHLKEHIRFLESPTSFPPAFNPIHLKKSYNRQIEEIDSFLATIIASNEPTILEEGSFEKLVDIAKLNFADSTQENRPYLLQHELNALSVAKGSLTSAEFKQIQNHVVHTYEFLKKIPWGSSLGNIPEIAGKHHEKLDGSGYPHSIENDHIPAQSRMMTIADIFDALTASDRPYKKAVPIERALDIIEMEVKAGKCDDVLFDIFIQVKPWLKKS